MNVHNFKGTLATDVIFLLNIEWEHWIISYRVVEKGFRTSEKTELEKQNLIQN